MSSTLGSLNPLRYRGYVYDEETGLYYLGTRYYSPKLGRFINADGYVSTGQGLLGSNMYAYCNNDPVDLIDPNGTDAIILYDDDDTSHIGAMIQDSNGDWWHFYWGVTTSFKRLACILSLDCQPDNWCVMYTGELNLSSINASGQYGYEYDDMLYLFGDFSCSAYSAQNASGNYNLLYNNCSQKTLSILSESDTQYKNQLNEAKQYVIPRNAFAFIQAKNNRSNKSCLRLGKAVATER